jgi:hypothetical protein
MLLIISWCVAVAVGVIVAFNAVFMLISPSAWFGLPNWLRAQGSLTKERYASGWGALQVRLTGALVLGTVGWVVYDMLRRY